MRVLVKIRIPKLCKLKTDNFAGITIELIEIGERNEVTVRFGSSKRKYGLNLNKANLEETVKTDICMNLFVENLGH